MPKRQKLDKIEAKAKHVYKVDSWHDPAKLLDDEDMGRKVLHVMKCIENGSPLPDGYYRKGIGRTGDTLLGSVRGRGVNSRTALAGIGVAIGPCG